MLTQERLKELLNYDPETGIFTWESHPFWKQIKGRKTGTPCTDGYLQISINNKVYLAHRLAWLWMTGEWPIGIVDHINMNRVDNRFSNLREATRSQNKMNCGAYKSSKSGVKGVTWEEDRKNGER